MLSLYLLLILSQLLISFAEDKNVSGGLFVFVLCDEDMSGNKFATTADDAAVKAFENGKKAAVH